MSAETPLSIDAPEAYINWKLSWLDFARRVYHPNRFLGVGIADFQQRRAPCAVRRAPCTVHRAPFGNRDVALSNQGLATQSQPRSVDVIEFKLRIAVLQVV